MDLHELTAEDMLRTLAERQAELETAEMEDSLAKARLEAVQGVVLDSLKKAGHPVEIAKKLMHGEPEAEQAYQNYLNAWLAFQKAKHAERRAVLAIDLWRTVRADVRRV